MNGTGLDHRLVRDYLRELDAALATLPAARARELRAQITAHLDEALQPGTDDQDVAEALARLGLPADLAAEAGAAIPAPLSAAIKVTARAQLARVGRRTWIRFGAAVIAAVIAAGYVVFYLSAGPLLVGPQSRWWYRQDWTREVVTTADGVTQTTVPIRSGQRQGFAVGIYNPTDVTQTVLGTPRGWPDSPAAQTAQTAQIAVSVPNKNIDHGGFITNVRFTLPAVIPPHQLRLLRVTWISGTCIEKGGASMMDQIFLRVRVGWFTRTERIPLGQGWAVSGPSHGGCS